MPEQEPTISPYEPEESRSFDKLQNEKDSGISSSEVVATTEQDLKQNTPETNEIKERAKQRLIIGIKFISETARSESNFPLYKELGEILETLNRWSQGEKITDEEISKIQDIADKKIVTIYARSNRRDQIDNQRGDYGGGQWEMDRSIVDYVTHSPIILKYSVLSSICQEIKDFELN